MVLEIDPLIGASHELLRLTKKWNPKFDQKLKILEDDNIDDGYKALLLRIVAHKQKNDENNRRNKRTKTPKKGKGMKDSSMDSELNGDPEYELYLKYLEKHGKSFRLKNRKGAPLVVGDIESEKAHVDVEPMREVNNALVVVHEKIPEEQAPRRLTRGYLRKYGQLDQIRDVENQYKNNPQPVLVKNTSNIDKVVCIDGPRSVDMHKGSTVANMKITEKKNRRTRGSKRKLDQMDGGVKDRKKQTTINTDNVVCLDGPRSVDMHKFLTVPNMKITEKKNRRTRGSKRKLDQMDSVGNTSGVKDRKKQTTSNTDNVVCLDGPRSVDVHKFSTVAKITEKKNRRTRGSKCKLDQMDGVGNSSGVKDRKKQTRRNFKDKGKVKVELPNQMPRLENYRESDLQSASAKNTKSLAPIKLEDDAKNVQSGGCSAEVFRDVKPAKCFMEDDKDKSDSEVVILDKAACVKKGALNPFVSSKGFHISPQKDGVLLIGESSATDVFRKEVLDDLNKPYDREEYKRLVKELRMRRYQESHPDLGKKFKVEKYKYNRRRRLALLRGFFFWLQNLSRDGAFRPWKDRECLAVEPPYP